MKKILSLSTALFIGFSAYSQCEGGRFQNNVFDGFFNNGFPSLPGTVNFGSNIDYQGTNKNLSMYIFQPDGDVAEYRPIVIMAFGGSFISGAKESPDVLKLCDAYVKKGYVAASIDYRIGADPIDSVNMMKAVLRGVQDMRAAVRFFRKDAATTNTYRIDTNNIFVGGVSAGAFIGIHTAYLDDINELQPWIRDSCIALGGLEGNSGNPGYSSKVKGVVNLCGAIGDTIWMQPGDPGIVSMHGTDDGTVPYGTEIINVSGNDIIYVNGSHDLDIRAGNIGIPHSFHTWPGADHVPFVNYIIPGSDGAKYMDSTINFTSDFLYHQVCDGVGIWGSNKENIINVYPNPSNNEMRIETGLKGFTATIYDLIGRKIRTIAASGSLMVFNKEEIGTGMFNLLITNDKKQISKRIIFE